MPVHQIEDVPTSISEERRAGVRANAFRVIQESDDEFLLDFVVYSIAERSAEVVGRVRVHKSLLPAIRGRLGKVLREFSEDVFADPEKH